MPMIDRWVVHHSLKALGACWKTIGAENPVFCINLSGQSFANPGFQAFIMDEINESGMPPQKYLLRSHGNSRHFPYRRRRQLHDVVT